MSSVKAKFDAVRKETGGLDTVIDEGSLKILSDEEIRQEALENRVTDSTPYALSKGEKRRLDLLSQMGYDLVHIDDLEPHPENDYSIDMESIENLAASIYESKNTEPLIIRNMGEDKKRQILAGERRWRAHRLLKERYGEAWAMVPARNLGNISDEQALFILHSDNLMQRVTSPSERAKGFEVIADNLIKLRETDPAFRTKYQGVKTRTILAEQLKVSEGTVANELAISRNLSDEGKELLDEGIIGKNQAVNIARLPNEKQSVVIDRVAEADLDDDQIDYLIKSARESDEISEIPSNTSDAPVKKKPATTDTYLKKARNALRKAYRSEGLPDEAILGEIKKFTRLLEQRETRDNSATDDDNFQSFSPSF